MIVFFDLEYNKYQDLALFQYLRFGKDKDVQVIERPKREQVLEILKGNHIVGYNLHNDLYVLGVRDLSIFEDYDDLLLAARLQWFWLKNYSLADVLSFIGVKKDKEEKKAFQDWFVNWSYGEPIPNNAIEYAKEDVRHLPHLYKALKQTLNSTYYKLVEKPMIEVVLDMQYRGLPVLEDVLEEYIEQTEKELQDMERALREDSRLNHINLNSPEQLKQALGVDTTKQETLIIKTLEATDERERNIYQSISRYRTLNKRLTLLNQYRSVSLVDKRLRGHFSITIAHSGRMACRDLNLQNIERELRGFIGFKPEDRRFLVCVDFPQIELRIAPLVGGGYEFQEAFEKGEDLHTKTAMALFPGQEITKRERQIAKTFNFGLLYGMGEQTLRKQILVNTRQIVSEEEAQTLYERFFDTYKSLKEWHERVKYDGRFGGIYKGITTLGRPFITNKLNEALNYPDQGTGAELLKLVASNSFKRGVRFINLVHDELLCEAESRGQAEEYVKVIAEETQKAWKLLTEVAQRSDKRVRYIPLPLDTDNAIIKTWGEKA